MRRIAQLCIEWIDLAFLLGIIILAFGGFVIMMIGLSVMGAVYMGVYMLAHKDVSTNNVQTHS
jgi:hypothetical protein